MKLPVVKQVQQHALTRSMVYLGSMAAILELANQFVYRPDDPYTNIHGVALPFVAAGTYGFVCLRDEDRQQWHQPVAPADLHQLGSGLVLGSSAILSTFSIAAVCGWVSAPAWGWSTHTITEVIRSVAVLTFYQLATVWNEEQVFRGYGFDTLQEAIGTQGAAVTLIALFAVYHGIDPMRLCGMVIGGLLFTLMRLESKKLWLPFGFHLAWNLWQIVIFGPPTAAPSLRPLYIHGPSAWIGTPGSPEPGLLSMIVLTILTLVLALRFWKRPGRQVRGS